MSNIRLFRADTFAHLLTMQAESIDTIVTSPPYWGHKYYNSAASTYGNEPKVETYRERTRSLCRELYRVLKPTGSLWINVGYKFHNKRLFNLPALWAEDAECEGFTQRQHIIWDKAGGQPPEAVKGRERDTHDVVLHLVKDLNGYWYKTPRAPYAAKPASAKRQHLRVRKALARRDLDYAQAQKAHAEIDRLDRLGQLTPVRFGTKREIAMSTKAGVEGRVRALKRDGFFFDRMNKAGAVGGNIWRVSRAGAPKGVHPCSFPATLAWECIRRTCPPGGVVLDPFMGSGSTAVAVKRLGLACIGIEILPEHFETAKRRVQEGK